MILKRIAPIRDILHGYMDFSPYEGYIIDTPYFQRLHWVHQTGFSFVTYPNSQNTRFAHSLGVAHLAGRIYVSALSHATSSTLDNFIKDACQLIKFASRNILGDAADFSFLEKTYNWWKGSEHRKIVPHHYPIYQEERYFNFHDEIEIYKTGRKENTRSIGKDFISDIIGISVKIYALLHDVGHLPVGHIFEYALHDAYMNYNDFLGKSQQGEANSQIFQHLSKAASAQDILNSLLISETNKDDSPKISAHENELNAKDLHEIRGYYIMKRIYEDIKAEFDKSEESYFMKICMSISILIAISEYINICDKSDADLMGAQRLLNALHSIVDSDVDADRLDYVMRDAQTSGIDIVKYDIDRIVDSYILLDKFKIYSVEKRSGEGRDRKVNKYLFSPGKKAISSLEVFFNQRKVLYDTLISHKSVLKLNATLQEVLACVFEVVFIYMYNRSLDKKAFQIATKIIEILDNFDWVTTQKGEEGIIEDIKYILGHDISQNYSLTSSDELSNALIYIDDAQMKTILLAIKSYLNKIDLSKYKHAETDDASKRLLLLLSRIPALVDVSINRNFDYVIGFVKSCLDVKRRGWDIGFKNNPYQITRESVEKEIINGIKEAKYNNVDIAIKYNEIRQMYNEIGERSKEIYAKLVDILRRHKRDITSSEKEDEYAEDVIFIYTFTKDTTYHNGQFIFCYFDQTGLPIVDDLIDLSPFLRSLKESVRDMDHYDFYVLNFYVLKNKEKHQNFLERSYKNLIKEIDYEKSILIKNTVEDIIKNIQPLKKEVSHDYHERAE